MLPINGDPNADCGPLNSFTAATLLVASQEGQAGNMAIRIKLLPCFGSSKWLKTELIMETVLSRNPLWLNTHFVDHKSNGEAIVGRDGQPLCQEMEISLCAPGGKLEYTSNHPGHPSPLTLVAFHPSWHDYLDLTETVAEMSQHLIIEDGQLEGTMPKEGTIPEQKDTAKIVVLPPNDDIKFVSASEFPSSPYGLSTRDNPVHLSNTPT